MVSTFSPQLNSSLPFQSFPAFQITGPVFSPVPVPVLYNHLAPPAPPVPVQYYPSYAPGFVPAPYHLTAPGLVPVPNTLFGPVYPVLSPYQQVAGYSPSYYFVPAVASAPYSFVPPPCYLPFAPPAPPGLSVSSPANSVSSPCPAPYNTPVGTPPQQVTSLSPIAGPSSSQSQSPSSPPLPLMSASPITKAENPAVPSPQPARVPLYERRPAGFSPPTGIDGVPEQLNGHHHMPLHNFSNVAVQNNNEDNGIRDVWADNLYDEFRLIRSLLHRYNHVAMDTEFPGVVARPIGEFRNSSEYQYQLLRVNVDMLNIIQLGLTFMDEHGNTPPGISTWQFNFKFNLAEEMYAQDSIELLTNAGIQFKKHETDGIDWRLFSEYFITSGFLLNDCVKWLSFHSGYDFGYLLKILINKKLPKDESGFFDLLKIYFPHIYDVKMFFEDNIDEAKYSGHLYGFGTSFAQSNDLTVYYVPPQSDHAPNNSY